MQIFLLYLKRRLKNFVGEKGRNLKKISSFLANEILTDKVWSYKNLWRNKAVTSKNKEINTINSSIRFFYECSKL